MTADLRTLIAYRMEQAQDSLRAADLLLDEKLWRDVVNRAYYGAFYTVLALLAMKGLGTSKHSGAISLFDREFVKTGIFSKELSFILHSSFDVRQEADYEELASIGEFEARGSVTQSREFVSKVSAYLADQLGDFDASEANAEEAV